MADREILAATFNKLSDIAIDSKISIDEELIEIVATNQFLENIFESKQYLSDDAIYNVLIRNLSVLDTKDIEKIITAYAGSSKWNKLSTEDKIIFIESELKSSEKANANEISLEELKNINMDINNRRMPDLEKILPQDHFINVVTRWMSGLSDTYYEYQVSSALWLLSDLIQGRGSLKLKQGTIKPNLYIMLLGQSTKSRKSTAVKKIENIREAATNNVLYNDEPTIEGYLEMLATNPVQSFVCDEASGLLAKFHKTYNEGIFDLECKIYDGQSVRKIKAAGRDKDVREIVVNNPYVTHLYATTPDKFASVTTLTDFLCGWGYRFIYAFPTYAKGRMDIMVEDHEDTKAWAEVMAATRDLYNRYSTMEPFNFKISKEALKLYNEIGQELEDETERLQNEQLDSAVARAEDNILKIAMLIEAGKSWNSTVITEESIIIASVLTLDFFLPSFMQTMDRVLSDIKANKIEKAMSVIRRMGGNCTRSTLIKNGHFTKSECDEVIEAMLIGEIVTQKQVKETKATVYILNSEDKEIKVTSSELSDTFNQIRSLRRLRTFRLFTDGTESIAKSAKLKEIKEVYINENDNTLADVSVFKSDCEYAKSAKCAKSAKTSDSNSETFTNQPGLTCDPALSTSQEVTEELKPKLDLNFRGQKMALIKFAIDRYNRIVENTSDFVDAFLSAYPAKRREDRDLLIGLTDKLKTNGWRV